MGELLSPNAIPNGGFGASVAVSFNANSGVNGPGIIVGAPNETDPAITSPNVAGRAYIFEKFGAVRQLTSFYPQPDGHFGSAVAAAVSNDVYMIAVAAVNETPPNQTVDYLQSGEVHVFKDAGEFLQTVYSSNPLGYSSNADGLTGCFGWSISIGNTQRGPTLAVGAPYESYNIVQNDPFEDTGLVHVFKLNAPGTQLIQAYSLGDPGQPGACFGWSVAAGASPPSGLSTKGPPPNLLVVGAPYEQTQVTVSGFGPRGKVLAVSGPPQSGGAYVFDLESGSPMPWGGRLTNPNIQTAPPSASQGMFGSSVDVIGNWVLVGDPFVDKDGYSAAGRAYIFDGATGQFQRELQNPSATADGLFGSVVKLVSSSQDILALISGNGFVYKFSATSGHYLGAQPGTNPPGTNAAGAAIGAGSGLELIGDGLPYNTDGVVHTYLL